MEENKLASERYFLSVDGDVEGWILIKEPSAFEDENVIELVDEFTNSRDKYPKAQVKEISEIDYLLLSNCLIDNIDPSDLVKEIRDKDKHDNDNIDGAV